jgi:PAS domain S-box-containing protein
MTAENAPPAQPPSDEVLFRLASIVASSDDAILSIDLQGRVGYWNAGAERLYGHTAAEVLGRNVSFLIPPQNENELPENLRRIRRGLHVEPYETVRLRKDGRQIHVSLTVSPVRNRAGEVIGASAAARDMTERRRMEEELARSERFARSIIDSLTAHIAVLDEKGTIVAVNKAWRDFAAANPPLRRNVCEGADYCAACQAVADDAARAMALAFAQGIQAVMSGGRDQFALEYPCHSPAEKRWFIGRVTRCQGPGPLRVVVAHENITERKLAEEDLRHYREHLEELVQARTLELEAKNVQLEREAAERRKAEAILRDSEARFRTLVNLAPDIIYRIRQDGTVDFISSAVGQLGYAPAELIGTPFEKIIHPDDRQRIRRHLVEKRIGERRTRNIEVRLLRQGDTGQDDARNHCHVELSARGYWDVADSQIARPDKRFLYTLGIAHDISGRKAVERALKESERRIGLLKDVASTANAAPTVEAVLRVAVEGIARYLGWPVGHVYGADEQAPQRLVSLDIWYLEDPGKFRLFMEETARTVFTPGVGMIGRVLESRKPLWIEDMALHPDFLRKQFADALPVRGAFGFPVIVGGEVTAVLEFFSDRRQSTNVSLMDLMAEIGKQIGIVIERKKAHETLRKLSRAIEQSPATVVITDVQGKIQYVNPKFSQLTGFAVQEAIGKNPRIMNSGAQPKAFYQELWSTILSGREWYGQFCNRKKNGETYWERASISPVRNEQGEIANFVAVKEDITQLLHYEEQLKRAKESAENANRAKSDFLASMSHELRTPLNAIIGFSEVLAERYFGALTDKQAEYVADILASGRHLLSLINDILDLSKVEAGKMELDLSTVAVSSLIDSSLTMVREKAARHRITLTAQVAADVSDLEIRADERKVKQILFNLLSNAVKFTPDGGSVRLSARHLKAQDPDAAGGGIRDDVLEICVADSGVGIRAEHQKRIFDPFYQVHGTQKMKPSGTGLGLPLSKDLIELHGGRIRVESDGDGQGSRFYVTLPRAPAPRG